MYICVLGSVKYIGRLEDNPVLGTYIGVELDAPGELHMYVRNSYVYVHAIYSILL